MGALVRATSLAARLVACLACASGARASDRLWGAENLLAGPKIAPEDIVTIVVADRTLARPAAGVTDAGDAEGGAQDAAAPTRCAPCRAAAPLGEIAARVVKVRANGNICLEARAQVGEGYVLIGGEAARADVSADRTVPVCRLANLAVVARGVEAATLEGFLRAAPAARVARAPAPTARTSPERE